MNARTIDSTPASALPAASLPLPTPTRIGLGLDAGGTQTRWALGDALGRVQAEGVAASMSGAQLGSAGGRAQIQATLQAIARECNGAVEAGSVAGPVQAAVAGVTGVGAEHLPTLCALVAEAFVLPADRVQAMSDIELACHAAFAPGEGYVVYAGTGSIAAFLDAEGTLQRAGGRGALIDDAGGGHWIAREALRRIWRAEDESPGAWRQSALAARVFERLGGSNWSLTRAWVYGTSRGELGTLALAVAAAAEEDPAALSILQAAGTELARLALALTRRHGVRPLALAGRVFDLHPAIEAHLLAALPGGAAVQRQMLPFHHAAAVLAARVPAASAAAVLAARVPSHPPAP